MAEQPGPKARKRTIEPQAPEQPKPWLPPACDPADVYALQAVYHGRATEDQQRRCMDFIIKELCGLSHDPYVPGPDGDRATTLAIGKQSVGRIITSLAAVRVNPKSEQP